MIPKLEALKPEPFQNEDRGSMEATSFVNPKLVPQMAALNAMQSSLTSAAKHVEPELKGLYTL